MHDLSRYNAYQKLLLCVLALVHLEDVVAIFRAARRHPLRNRCIDLVNIELDKGIGLFDIFEGDNNLHDLFRNDWPELRVMTRGDRISLEFGTNGADDVVCWEAEMERTGVVRKLDAYRIHFNPRNGPPGPAPQGWDPFKELGLD